MTQVTAQSQSFFESNAIRTMIAIIAIIVSVTLYFLNRKRKTLTYRVVRRGRLFQGPDALQGRLQILLDGSPATDVSLVLIEILNSGNEPIQAADFRKPLRFQFKQPSSVLGARVFWTRPRDLDARTDFDKNGVELTPLLLNAGDAVTLEVLLDNFEGQIEHTVRVVGISQVRASEGSFERYRGWRTWVLTFLFALLATLTVARLAMPSRSYRVATSQEIADLVFCLAALLYLLIRPLDWRHWEDRERN